MRDATQAFPFVGSMTAVRSLMSVDFPAPSGPTRPKSSPFRISMRNLLKGLDAGEFLCQGFGPDRDGVIHRVT